MFSLGVNRITRWREERSVRRKLKGAKNLALLWGAILALVPHCGQMSAWYVFTAMGFYPVDPVSGVIGSPLVDKVTRNLDSEHYHGNHFTVTAKNNSPKNIYIQSTELNGKPMKRSWIGHNEISAGGELVLIMGPTPNKMWASAPASRPGITTNMNEARLVLRNLSISSLYSGRPCGVYLPARDFAGLSGFAVLLPVNSRPTRFGRGLLGKRRCLGADGFESALRRRRQNREVRSWRQRDRFGGDAKPVAMVFNRCKLAIRSMIFGPGFLSLFAGTRC